MIQFRMQQIKVDQFAILSDKLPDNGLNMTTSLGVGADANSHTICIKLKTDFINNDNILLTLAISCYFQLSPESWTSNTVDGKTTIKRQDISHLAMHAFGTARGILYCKTEGSPFQSLILPPTNVDKIIADDLVV